MRIITVGGLTPIIAGTAWLAPDASVIGDVEVGSEASIWYGTVLRADADAIRIGAGSNLQDGCVAHTDAGLVLSVGVNVSVGHRAVLHGCTVEDDVLIGMGAVLLNGCRIGTGSLVAAGTVVLEGTQIPPNSLVAGVPGKVRRETSDAERAAIARNAAHYRELRMLHAETAGVRDLA